MSTDPEEHPLSRDEFSGSVTPDAFGAYRVLHQVATGALGPVFRAHDEAQGRLAAVKAFRLEEHFALAGPIADALGMLVEALPDIDLLVPLVGAGQEGDTPFLAMRYESGETLDLAVRRLAPAPIDVAMTLLGDLAWTLDESWRAGLGHGGLSPRDIFLDDTGALRSLNGIGIVQSLEGVGLAVPARRVYTAPERTAGRWDVRADVYSLAAIAHELLTRRRPLRTGEPDDDFDALVGDVARRAIQRVVTAGLAEDPAARFPSATAFVDALGEAAGLEAPREATGAGAPIGVADDEPGPVSPGDPAPGPSVEPDPGPIVEPEPPIIEPDPGPQVDVAPGPQMDMDLGPPRAADLEPTPVTPPVIGPEPPVLPRPARPDAPAALGAATAIPLEVPLRAARERQPLHDLDLDAPGPDEASARAQALSADFLRARDEDGTVVPTGPALPADWVTPGRPVRRRPVAGAAVAIVGLLLGGGLGWLLLRPGQPVSSAARADDSERATSAAPGRRPLDGPPPGPRTEPGPSSAPGLAASPATRPAPARSATPVQERRRAVADAPSPAARAAPHRLTVRSEPSGALVRLDGRLLGTTPVLAAEVAPGSHVLVVARPGFVPYTETVIIADDRPATTITVAMQGGAGSASPVTGRAPSAGANGPPAPAFGAIDVDSRARGARVMIDGRFVGRAPLRISEVAPGAHTVGIEIPDHSPLVRRIQVEAGQIARVRLDPE